ncbi:DNA damage-induced SOS-independent cell division inhibitor A [Caulobacter sp. ErkDOM-E]|uniref:DNA damage-induced SOS-independent cell division inhibitor A n=1 Tax=Caulobacter sp. ErkDOM-E TaxID=3402778 RepID=UPI003AF59FF2
MTDYAMPDAFQPTRRPARPGRPTGVVGAVSYAGVLLVWLALFVVDRPLAMKVFRERRADSPIRRHWSW